MTSRLEKVATLAMATAAIAVAAKYLLTGPSARQPSPLVASIINDEPRMALATKFALPVEVIPNRIQILEFIDVECPYCAKYAADLDSLAGILRDSIQVRYVNFPLSSHRFAKSGAIAIECAFRMHHGAAFVSTTYANRDSIGFWTWPFMAQRAGISDTATFAACSREPGVRARVDSSREAATALEIPGTPTVFVGAWRYESPPDIDRLLRDIRGLAAGKNPK